MRCNFTCMRIATIFMSLLLLGMSWLPCTDMVPDQHEHAHQVVDPTQTTGESPFHEDTCPVFCSCGCCATLIVTNDFTPPVFRFFVAPQSQPVQLQEQQVKNVAFVWWHPPRLLV